MRAWIEIRRILGGVKASARVALFVRAWIEIWEHGKKRRILCSRSLRESVDWNRQHDKSAVLHDKRRSLRESVDWNLRHVVWLNQRVASLSSWERGLKLLNIMFLTESHVSLSSWERGLKYCRNSTKNHSEKVALFVRAWIEIFTRGATWLVVFVASFADAWIEIL